jgi:ubiquinone/menaquinone biosynthesis C-methylase UbiE
MSFFENTRKPIGLGGKIMVTMMNLGHSPVARWGLRFLELTPDAKVLDCGCGGGANIKRLLKKCPQGVVKGIDYSPVSVEKSKRVNEAAVTKGRCTVLRASVAELPFESEQFDAVTAFETVYFWPDLPQCFREVWRVLKSGGTFLICNESNGDTDKDEKWTEIIGGMTIYKDIELKSCLEQAGFFDVQIHKKKTWLCVTARKR